MRQYCADIRKRKDYQNAMKYARLCEQAAKAIGAMKQIFMFTAPWPRFGQAYATTKRPTTFSTKPDLKDTHCLTGSQNDKHG